jgi:peptidoglycan/xylan/chitin deacetylase (PgdA/CDA1 family)
VRLPLALATVTAAGWSLPALACHVPPIAQALGIPRRMADGGVALTFDDGPHPEGTPAVLAALERAGVRATFFLVGEQVERQPALAAEVAGAGHAVALHGFRHRSQLRRTPGTLRDDLRRGAAAIQEATGVSPTIYRPPYGIFSAGGLAVVRSERYWPWLWSRWGRDWRADATPEGIAAKATENLGAGDVVLLHDADHYAAGGSHRNTVQALPRILETVAEHGLEPVMLPTDRV